MISEKPFSGALIGSLSWIVGYWVMYFLGEGMSAINAYALLTGWWLTAYISSKLSLSVTAAILLSFGYWLLFIIAAMAGQSWFYKDAFELPFLTMLWVGALQAIFVGSPIVFDRAFGYVGQVGVRLIRGFWG